MTEDGTGTLDCAQAPWMIVTRLKDYVATCGIEWQVVDVEKNTVQALAVATDSEVVPLIVAPVGGYSVIVLPPALLMWNTSPASEAGRIAPPADVVVTNTFALVILVASDADEPARVMVCAVPAMAFAERG